MYYYKLKDKLIISRDKVSGLYEIDESKASSMKGLVFALNSADILKSRRSFSVSHPSLLFLEKEDLNLLRKLPSPNFKVPQWLYSKIESRDVISVNISYPTWQDLLEYQKPIKWHINVVGLGDVGGTLITGLRLLGGEYISKIGIYDINENKVKRWIFECNQIYDPFNGCKFPPVQCIPKHQLFDCDMFVFCVSAGVPPVGSETKDVRMAQFEGNSSIIKYYARKARESNFKGIFAVVSDPVDLLCKVALIESNRNENGDIDYCGLSPEQIRGYGLGVMNARAAYYASQDCKTIHYLNEGRAFGPHGDGLVIADSICNYNEDLSILLTKKAKYSNIELRKIGFKPYIAPAFSSGVLPLIATINGSWHYSATFVGGVYMGSKNRLNKSGIELESLDIPEPLWKRIEATYKRLEALL